jgi:hypothetical protein
VPFGKELLKVLGANEKTKRAFYVLKSKAIEAKNILTVVPLGQKKQYFLRNSNLGTQFHDFEKSNSSQSPESSDEMENYSRQELNLPKVVR